MYYTQIPTLSTFLFTFQLPQKMIYLVEIFGNSIKDPTVHLYSTNFLKFPKKIFWKIFFNLRNLVPDKRTLVTFINIPKFST